MRSAAGIVWVRACVLHELRGADDARVLDPLDFPVPGAAQQAWMQAYEKALIGGETSLILSPDSEFFKFFGNIKPKSQ